MYIRVKHLPAPFKKKKIQELIHPFAEKARMKIMHYRDLALFELSTV